MTTDNISNNILFIQRKEIEPYNTIILCNMTHAKIFSILNNPTYHTTKDDILTKYPTINKTNYKTLIQETCVLTNEDASIFIDLFFASYYIHIKSQTMIPPEGLTYYVANIFEPHLDINYNTLIIGIQINLEYLDDNFYKSFKFRSDKLKIENRYFCDFIFSQMKYHFEETNNIKHDVSHNVEISSRISKANINYMSQPMIEQPVFLNYKMYYYQLADVYWMLNREYEETKFILDTSVIINWGPQQEFNLYEEKFIPKRTIHNYTGELNSFRGGCYCSFPGSGKTLSTLVLCALKPSLNLIIVPEHLQDSWIFEYSKHINSTSSELIVYDNTINIKTLISDTKSIIIICKYKDITPKLLKVHFTRLIIDEFHEFFDTHTNSTNIHNIKANYKWAVTGTPLINSDMIYNILNFVVKNKVPKSDISKYKVYLDIFEDMFRKNTEESVKCELRLPKINEKIYILKLSPLERIMLDSIMNNNTLSKKELEDRQMAICTNVNLYFMDNNSKIEKFDNIQHMATKVANLHKKDYEKLYNIIIKEKSKICSLSEAFTGPEVELIYNGFINKHINDIENIQTLLINYYSNQYKVEDSITLISDMKPLEIFNIFEKFLQTTCKLNNQHLDILKYIKNCEKQLMQLKSNIAFFKKAVKIVTKKVHTLSEELKITEYVEISKPTLKLDDPLSIMNKRVKTDSETYVAGGGGGEASSETYVAGGGGEASSEESVDDVHNEMKDCTLCYDTLNENCTLLQCGHIFCTECLTVVLEKSIEKCPLCRTPTTMVLSPKMNKTESSEISCLIQKYGTKIYHLINICKTMNPTNKIVIYCDSPSLIFNIITILNENQISTIMPQDNIITSETLSLFKTSYQALVLSSEMNASGLNIQFANTIIIVQPIRGSYERVKQIENQIIGRLYRIGQTMEIDIHRLIIKDSIETNVIRQHNIINDLYKSINIEMDECHTEKIIEEL
jgi:hypothetical protein